MCRCVSLGDGGVELFTTCARSGQLGVNGCKLGNCTHESEVFITKLGEGVLIPEGLLHRSMLPQGGVQQTVCTFLGKEARRGDRRKTDWSEFEKYRLPLWSE